MLFIFFFPSFFCIYYSDFIFFCKKKLKGFRRKVAVRDIYVKSRLQFGCSCCCYCGKDVYFLFLFTNTASYSRDFFYDILFFFFLFSTFFFKLPLVTVKKNIKQQRWTKKKVTEKFLSSFRTATWHIEVIILKPDILWKVTIAKVYFYGIKPFLL